MAEHEPRTITDQDALPDERDEPRAARTEPRMPEADKTSGRKGRDTKAIRASGTDDAQVASEPMDLQRFPDDDGGAQPPAGRQRTGDPPSR